MFWGVPYLLLIFGFAGALAPDAHGAGEPAADSERQAGDGFRDCPDCPEMVVVPAGSFTMDSAESEEGRRDREGPQHEVTIAEPYAIGKYEVTFDEWQACVKAGGCEGHEPDDLGLGRGRRPVIHVSWNDAQTYVAWLSEVTGRPYRLPSEAEWEYAARAGTTTRFVWGEEITRQHTNFGSEGTVEVGSYPSNPWGLHDVDGNVWEWVEDCYHPGYDGAPSDGSVWASSDCKRWVLRGSSWDTRIAEYSRTAFRFGEFATIRYKDGGFRVARTLR